MIPNLSSTVLPPVHLPPCFPDTHLSSMLFFRMSFAGYSGLQTLRERPYHQSVTLSNELVQPSVPNRNVCIFRKRLFLTSGMPVFWTEGFSVSPKFVFTIYVTLLSWVLEPFQACRQWAQLGIA